jgi:uncharacterized membrane protein
MEYITALKTLHIVAIALLLLGGFGLATGFIKVRLEGDQGVQTRMLQRPLSFIWIQMAVCLAILPFTGWWLVHLQGLSLGQTWILGSSVFYTVAIFCWAWLVVRLNRLRRGKAGGGWFTSALALVSGLGFVAIAGLLLFRPA